MISIDYANSILQHFFCGEEMAAITTPYLGLCAEKPAANGSVTNAGEPTDKSSYKREPIGITSFGPASQGKIQNTVEIQFSTAKESWGNLNFWFLTGRSSGSSAILWGDLTEIVAKDIDVSGFSSGTSSFTTVLNLADGELYRFEGQEGAGATPYAVTLTADWDNANQCFNLAGTDNDGGSWEYVYTPTFDAYGAASGTLALTLYPEDGVDVTAWTLLSIYHAGVNVLQGVVPTFAAGTLSASIDADK